MRLAAVVTIWMCLGAMVSTQAQDSDPLPILAPGTTEWMVTGGPALGVVLFHSAEGHKYFLQSVSWGRILTRAVGPGALRGRFEWSFEFIPVYGQYEPDNSYGVGVTPLLWRWNFEPRGRVAPFFEVAAGGLWTRDPVPAGTTTANFTGHGAYGIRYFLRPHTAFVAAYRFQHISNGNRLEQNPGVNAHLVQVGVSVLRPH